jgi:hypothetical protein
MNESEPVQMETTHRKQLNFAQLSDISDEPDGTVCAVINPEFRELGGEFSSI